MDTNIKILGGFVAGTLAGLAAGYLTAPKSGKETRKQISKRTKKVTDDLIETGEKKLDEFKSSYNEKVDLLAKNGKKGINNIKEKVAMN